MRTFLAIIGGLALMALIVIGATFFYAFQQVAPLISQARNYADESLIEIASDWNGAALEGRAAPELALLLQGGVTDQLMSEGTRLLGKMTEAEGSICELESFHMSSETGRIAKASCAAAAAHERGDATYRLSLIKRDDEWRLLGFFVTPTPGTERNAPVMVNGPLERTPFDVFEASLANGQFGWSTGATVATGASIRPFEKIENF